MKRINVFIIFLILIFTSVVKSPIHAQDTVEIVRVLDNSTLEVIYRHRTKKIKLIGIYNPRAWRLYRNAKKYSKYAKHVSSSKYRGRAASLMRRYIRKGDVLNIEFDKGKKDSRYHSLVYLYFPNQKMVNEEIIKAGYAYPYILPPNIKYRERFLKAYHEAVRKKRGMWKDITPPPADKSYISLSSSITIMTFNVENLFDTKHDRGKNDYTFLPLSRKGTAAHRAVCSKQSRYRKKECLELDWSERVLRLKMKRLAGTILQLKKGRGADILILQEVENRSVLERLRREYLKKAGYRPSILIEGPDYRGIDVAILSRLPVSGRVRLHRIKFKGVPRERATSRGILEAAFKLPDGNKLTAFALHLPSQANPYKMRKQALQYLMKLKKKLPRDRMAIAAGDFNISTEEAMKKHILSNYMDPCWLISQWIGCEFCVGSSYYPRKNTWSFFDMILLSKNFSPDSKYPAPWVVITESVRIANSYSYQVAKDGTPARFKGPKYKGVSDHWPMVLEIRPR